MVAKAAVRAIVAIGKPYNGPYCTIVRYTCTEQLIIVFK